MPKLEEQPVPLRCYSETQLDVHIPHSPAVGGQSASVCPKGRGVGETHSGFTRQHAVLGTQCISIQAAANNAGCRYVSQHQRETSAKVVSSFIDPV